MRETTAIQERGRPGSMGSVKVQQRKFWGATSVQDDELLGGEVYDRNHQLIVVIKEVYCDRVDLMARYVEIIPLALKDHKTYLYPFERLVWQPGGPIFLSTSYEELQQFKDYRRDAVMINAGRELITYNQALAAGCEWMGSQEMPVAL